MQLYTNWRTGLADLLSGCNTGSRRVKLQDQEAGERERADQGHHPGVGRAGRRLKVAHGVGSDEPAEVPDRVDQSNGSRRGGLAQNCGRQGPERRGVGFRAARVRVPFPRSKGGRDSCFGR